MKKLINHRVYGPAIFFAISALVALVLIQFLPEAKRTAPMPPAPTVSAPPPVEEAPMGSGAVCLTVQMDAKHPLSGCKIDFLSIGDDPQPENDPTGACSGAGRYYFPQILAGKYNIVAFCGDLTAEIRLETEVQPAVVGIATEKPKVGQLYSLSHGHALDPKVPSVELSGQICEGQQDGSCSPLSASQMSSIRFTPSPACRGLVKVNGTVLSAAPKMLTSLKQDVRCLVVASLGDRQGEIFLLLTGKEVNRF